MTEKKAKIDSITEKNIIFAPGLLIFGASGNTILSNKFTSIVKINPIIVITAATRLIAVSIFSINHTQTSQASTQQTRT
jgi:hypothetical protein